jgi:class 3 adenylate cyclase
LVVRVVRCFGFLDLCGFTEYTETHGDADAVAALAQLRATLRAEAERCGVRVTKWLGDGAMLSGVEAPHVVRCVANVLDQAADTCPLPLRGGLAEGPVIMFEGDDYIGAAVNLAARLCQVAKPGQILLADGLAGRAADVGTRPFGDVEVPGLGEPVPAWELSGEAA